MNPYIDEETKHLCLQQLTENGILVKRYKVNKEGLFEEVTN